MHIVLHVVELQIGVNLVTKLLVDDTGYSLQTRTKAILFDFKQVETNTTLLREMTQS